MINVFKITGFIMYVWICMIFSHFQVLKKKKVSAFLVYQHERHNWKMIESENNLTHPTLTKTGEPIINFFLSIEFLVLLSASPFSPCISSVASKMTVLKAIKLKLFL